MKRVISKTFSILLVTIIMSGAQFSAGLAVPPLPSSFYGTVTINGNNAPVGTVVSAWINGVQYAFSQTILYGTQSVYSLDVPGDDPATPAIEGGVEGDAIEFRIGGQPAQEVGYWHSGTNLPLNLSLLSDVQMIFLPMIVK